MDFTQLIYDTLTSYLPEIECIQEKPLIFYYQGHTLEFGDSTLNNSLTDNIVNFLNLEISVNFDGKKDTFYFKSLSSDLPNELIEYVFNYLKPLTLENVVQYLNHKNELINQIEIIQSNQNLIINDLFEINLVNEFQQSLFIHNKKRNEDGHYSVFTSTHVYFDLDKGYEPCLNLFFKDKILPYKENLMRAFCDNSQT